MSIRDAPQNGTEHLPHIAVTMEDPRNAPRSNGEKHEGDTGRPDPQSSLLQPPGEKSSLHIRHGSGHHSPHLQIPGTPSLGGLAMAAIQYLPYPLMVLDNQKTLVMANEAMGRLLDIEDHER